MKLTKAQQKALESLPVALVMWGGRPLGGMPEGINSIRTLEALRSRGLATYMTDLAVQKWRLTDAGRALLAEEKQDA